MPLIRNVNPGNQLLLKLTEYKKVINFCTLIEITLIVQIGFAYGKTVL